MPQSRSRLERFMSHIATAGEGCWIWTGALTGSRGLYGSFWNGRKSCAAHRWSYLHFKGAIRQGLEIDHLCRNPACVNPDHLEAVPHSVNIARSTVGESLRLRRRSKIHCDNGHEFTAETTGHQGPNKYRFCRVCRRASYLARKNGKVAHG